MRQQNEFPKIVVSIKTATTEDQYTVHHSERAICAADFPDGKDSPWEEVPSNAYPARMIGQMVERALNSERTRAGTINDVRFVVEVKRYYEDTDGE